MILLLPAAGWATRMYPLTRDVPKALLPLGGGVILDHVVEQARQISLSEIMVITNSRFYPQFCSWAQQREFKVPVKILDDGTASLDQRLGTVGDLLFAIVSQDLWNQDILIIHPDNLFSFDLRHMEEVFRAAQRPLIAVHDVGDPAIASRMGVPTLADDGEFIDFTEKPSIPTGTIVTVGIYFLPKSVLPCLEAYVREGGSTDRTGDFIGWLQKRVAIFGFMFGAKDGFWIDVGSKEQYQRLQNFSGCPSPDLDLF